RHHKACRAGGSVIGTDYPARGLVSPRCRRHARLEKEWGADIQLVSHPFQIGQDFRLPGKALRPLPSALYLFGKGVAVVDRFEIAAGTGIPVHPPFTPP